MGPMVRRSAAQHLGAYAEKLEKSLLTTEVMTMFSELCDDDQDSVRLLAGGSCSSLSKLLGKDGCISKILPTVQKFSVDKSWRVRYMVAQQVYELCEVIGKETTIEELVPVYVKLLKDNEAEVRVAAAGKAGDFCSFVGGELTLNQILPPLMELSNDTSQHVRAAIATVVMAIAPIFENASTVEWSVLPIILTLLRDEYPDVRLNIISNLEQVSNINGILGKLCIKWLEDGVSTIRYAAAHNLKRLAEDFGSDWVQEFVFPQMLDKIQHPHYLYRMTILEAVAAMATVVSSDILTTVLLPEMLKCNKDRVPNVRFHVCKLMKEVIPHVDPSIVESTIKPWLTDLQDDDDGDVRFYSRDALTACH